MRFPARLLPAGALLLALLSGCGTTTMLAMPTAHAPMLSSVYAKSGVPQTKDDFVAAVKAAGVTLSAADLNEIAQERTVKPNGQWAPRPAENLTADQNLSVHFNKHGHEFHPALTSEQDYLKQAIAAATGARGTVHYYFDVTSFDKGYQTHVVRWNPVNHDFCAVRNDGAMTTYYQNFRVQAKRYIEVPLFN
jgi:hypothetical protein